MVTGALLVVAAGPMSHTQTVDAGPMPVLASCGPHGSLYKRDRYTKWYVWNYYLRLFVEFYCSDVKLQIIVNKITKANTS